MPVPVPVPVGCMQRHYVQVLQVQCSVILYYYVSVWYYICSISITIVRMLQLVLATHHTAYTAATPYTLP